jgi:hypothetical protein
MANTNDLAQVHGKAHLTLFSIHDIYRHIFKIWRERRFSLFVELIRPSISDSLLDVGGYPVYWVSKPRLVKSIDILNIHSIEVEPVFRTYELTTVIGDGCSLPYADQSFDIVHSNSVIEHVGDWSRQQAFASELRRVGKTVWVQTPAFECPIEPHYLAPFIHYLPKSIRKPVIRWLTPMGWIDRPSSSLLDELIESTRLLKKSEMKVLFPDCEIITERLFGVLPKSYIAIKYKTDDTPLRP